MGFRVYTVIRITIGVGGNSEEMQASTGDVKEIQSPVVSTKKEIMLAGLGYCSS